MKNMGIGDWGLRIGDCGLGPMPNAQVPNSQSPIPKPPKLSFNNIIKYLLILEKINNK